MADDVQRSTMRTRWFSDSEFDFQFIRMLGASAAGGSALGECYQTASQIPDGDNRAWVRAWAALGERLAGRGGRCFEQGHRISARELYHRASSAYRSAEYYADVLGTEQRELGLRACTLFRRAAPLFDPPHDVLSLPYESGIDLPGYFWKAHRDTSPRKTLVVMNGYDGTSEENYVMIGHAALQRGYNVLSFDGPGQTGCLRHHPKLPFRPDWEVVISKVLDTLLQRSDVDPERLALYGISFGGHLSARAACHERRLAALVCNSPIIDWFAYLSSLADVGFDDASEDVALTDLPELPDTLVPPAIKQMLATLCRKYGASSFFQARDKIKAYRVDEALSEIRCPTLAMIGEGEGTEAMRQTDEFCSRVSGLVTKHVFTIEEGADAHCQLNNLPLSGQVVLDFLDEQFDRGG